MYRKTPVPDWTVADEERERQLEMKEEQIHMDKTYEEKNKY